MPWSHCEEREIHDDSPCPTCGISKAQWTLEFNVTRQFVVRSASALRVVLLDQDEEGVGEEPYRIELPDGTAQEGELDEHGTVKIRHSQEGEAKLSFPQRKPGWVQPFILARDPDEEEAPAEEDDEDDEDDAGGESEDEEQAEEATFYRAALGRYRFQLCPRLLQLTLTDWSRHHPLCFTDYELEAEDGTSFSGTTDGWGRLDHGEVEAERWRLSIGGESLTVPAVVPAAAFLPVRVPHELRPLPAYHSDKEEHDEPNPRWSSPRCRFDEVVELIFLCPELDDEQTVEFEIFEHDEGGEDDPVVTITAPVEGGEARVGWRMRRYDDSDDEPTELDRETGFALPEFGFSVHYGAGEQARCEGLLTFSTDLELPLRDAGGSPLANADYELHCGDQLKRGSTDGEGVLRESGVGPNFEIFLASGERVVVHEGEGS